jgi:hypothetical protein
MLIVKITARGIEEYNVLPFYRIRMAIEMDKKGNCKKCKLASYIHLLDENGSLYCTLDILKEKPIKVSLRELK